MTQSPDLKEVFEETVEAFEEALRKLGKVNVLIAGRTGVGKSTLINSIFHGNMAVTGQGKPVTQTTRLISKEGIPLSIWDTRGLEMSDFKTTHDELMELVEKCAKKTEAQDHIHAAWLCVHEDGRRVESAEVELCRALAQRMPVLGVITKARRDDGFRAEVQQLLPDARQVVRVRAIAEQFDDGDYSLPPMGLVELVECTHEVLPEGARRAFAAAQKVSLSYKRRQARAIIAGASVTAAAACAVPIPFSNVAVLVPTQVAMLASISGIFGLEISMTTLSALVGASGTATLNRYLAASLLKLIPGAGSVAGSVIGAATAGILTTTLGEIYIATLVAVFTKTGGETPDIDSVHQEFTIQLAEAISDDSIFKKLEPTVRKLLKNVRDRLPGG